MTLQEWLPARSHPKDVLVVMRSPQVLSIPKLGEADVARLRGQAGLPKQFATGSAPVGDLSVAVLHNCLVLGDRGIILTASGVVGECIGTRRVRFGEMPNSDDLALHLERARAELDSAPVVDLAEAAIGCMIDGDLNRANYYHFHAEFLAALVLLGRLQAEADLSVCPIVMQGLTGWRSEAARLAGIPADQHFALGKRMALVRRLYVPTMLLTRTRVIDPFFGETFGAIRSAVMAGRDTDQQTRPKILYVSRQDTTARPMSNEQDLIERLRERGVEIFLARGRDYADQVAAFAGRRLIVGAHGAGLTNMGFASAGSRILEIFPPARYQVLYYRMAGVLGHGYRCFPARGTEPAASDNESWELELDEFLAVFDEVAQEWRASTGVAA
ncbi:glycosyltransferase family 61 protein [Pararoseomonas baculiformis]|nr:glycosyltransferase family 61 protein [Pararoseomonas baculiformis]